jgi:hypothetical protein
MTSPPRRPIISLKFKTPDAARGDIQPPAPQPAPARPASPPPPPSPAKPAPARSPSAKPLAGKPAFAKPVPARPAPPVSETPKAEPARKHSPAISPDIFKAAVKAAGIAIQHVVADPEWKSEDLLHQYQAAKEHATSTHKQQAKLVSTVATRRHGRDIDEAGVENPAMRAAYAAALVALVEAAGKHE